MFNKTITKQQAHAEENRDFSRVFVNCYVNDFMFKCAIKSSKSEVDLKLWCTIYSTIIERNQIVFEDDKL